MQRLQQRIETQRTLPDLVTVPEAARFLGIGRKAIYLLLEYGELRAIRERGKILIDPCCLYEFYNKGMMT